MKFLKINILAIAGAALVTAVSSCSTTRVLAEGEQRLRRNVVEVTNDRKFDKDEIIPYIKQASENWSPFICIYNWQTGKSKGWDKFVRELGTAPVVYDSTLLNSSVSNIQTHLSYLGYYDSKVSVKTIPARNRNVDVKYSVTLGKRYPISKVTFEVPTYGEFANAVYADTANFSVKKGSYLSEQSLEAETVRATSALRNKGYFDFSKNYYFFEADTLSDPGMARLHVIIRNHTRNETEDADKQQFQYKVGQVRVHLPENLKFRPRVLRELNNVKTGSVYSEDAVNVAFSRFNSIGLFNSVNINMIPDQKQRTVDCDINLSKAKTQGFKVGFEASVNTSGLFGLSPEISYYHRNIFHGGEILNVSVSTNHQFKLASNINSNEVTVAATLQVPRFLPFPTTWFNGPNIPRTEARLAYTYQQRPEYQRNRVQASFGYLGVYKKFFKYQVNPIALNVISLSYISPEFLESIKNNSYLLNSFTNQMDLGLNSILYYNTSESVVPRKNYWMTQLNFDISGNAMSLFNFAMPLNDMGRRTVWGSPYAQYVRAEFLTSKTFIWDGEWWHSFAVKFDIGAGHAYGNSVSLPYEKTFFCGGANSLRGWTARSVGPGTAPLDTYWKIPNQTGDFKLEASWEYRFRIFWRIYGAVFMDAGNVWMLGTPPSQEMASRYLSAANFGESIAADWGGGIRFDASYLLFRVDFGVRMHDPGRGENKWVNPFLKGQKDVFAFHFGVGYPF